MTVHRMLAIFLVGVLAMGVSTGQANGRGDERGKLIRPENNSWLKATSVEDVIDRWPERVDMLLEALDLEYPGLEKVKTAVEKGDRAAACRALLDYYQKKGREKWIVDRLGDPGEHHIKKADRWVNDRHKWRDVTSDVPVEHGAWNWNYTGPVDYREFAFHLNRHSVFSALYQAWRKTGEAKYARTFDRRVRDWILHTVCPGENYQDSFTWRVLEAGLRMKSWPVAFHGFLKSEHFTPAGRLLMLSSIPEHGRYIKMHHWEKHNHALMEHDGLNRIGLAFPEFEEAEEWHRYAFNEMLKEMGHQVYPDGAHDELSSEYHWVSLRSFENLANVTRAAGREVPEEYRTRLVDMYDYFAGLMRPDGSSPLNNRADRSMIERRILRAAKKYDRPEWQYIATNGEEGERPEGLPSDFYPWAGHLVSRSSWAEGALWSFFDAGPMGNGAVDADALHLSITAYGKDFLVDSGRFWYKGDKWTTFARSSRSHNVILIDGKGQQKKPRRVEEPLNGRNWKIAESFDCVRKTHQHFNGLEGEADHTRQVVFLREAGAWIVFDRISTDRPREITPMWRFYPDRNVELGDNATLKTADDEGANFSITPVGNIDWDVKLICGQEDPDVQGFYSEFTPNWEPNTVAEYSSKIDGDAMFAWVMLPTEDGAANLPEDIEWKPIGSGIASLEVTWPDGRSDSVTAALDENDLPAELQNGRKLLAPFLLEGPDREPEVGSGWLVNEEGEVIAADPPPLRDSLSYMADRLQWTARKGDGREFELEMPLVNKYAEFPLKISAKPAPDNAKGWTINGLPAGYRLELGEKKTLEVAARAEPGRPRYPIPAVDIELTAESRETGETFTESRRLFLPVVGSQPPVSFGKTAQKPDIDGKLADAAWDRDPDVPVFGRMDLERSTEPGTRAWASYDDEALYVAFRCEEPRIDNLKLKADERDGDVWKDDSVEIMFDPTGKAETYYQLIVSADGVIYDGKKFDNSVDLENVTAQTQVSEDADAWTAEIKIPWEDVGLDGPPEKAGILLGRNRQTTGEHEVFQFPVSPKGNHQPDHFAVIHFTKNE